MAMLNNPHHIGVFRGNGEKERRAIEKMFKDLYKDSIHLTLSPLAGQD
jgi:hypothetical protein